MASVFLFLIVVCIFTYSASLKDVDYNIDLERMETIPGDEKTVCDFSKLRITKKVKEYFVNGTFTFMENIDNNYIIGAEISHSPMMNSRFVKSPFRIPPYAYCEYINTVYKDQMQPELLGKTNFPFIPEEGMCPIPKGTYYIKELQMPVDLLPPHMAPGMWRFEHRLFVETRSVGGFRLLAKFTAKEFN